MKFIVSIVFIVSLLGCSSNISPKQVKGEIQVGQYFVSPPNNFWYYPRKYPNKIAEGEYYLLTFSPNEESLTEYSNDIFLNFGVTKNKYTSFENYYHDVKKHDVVFNDLPGSLGKDLTLSGWNCKIFETSQFGVECVSLRDDLITIGIFGQNKETVISKIPLFKRMLLSFR